MNQEGAMSAAIAMQAIEQAKLTDKQYRAARRLLDRCHESGQIVLTHEAAKEVITTSTAGATRRLLGQLKAAGIIRYSVNGYVYINFTCYPPDAGDPEPRSISDHPRAISDQGAPPIDPEPRSISDHPRAESDHPRAISDHGRSGNARNCFPTYTHARGRVGWLVGNTPSTSKCITNQPTTNADSPKLDPVAQAVAFGLLKSAGIMASNAKRLAEAHSLDDIRRHVGHWWDHRDDTFRSPGIVVTWLDNPEGAGIPDCSTEFRRSALYRQWRTKAEIAAEQAAEEAALARLQEEPPAQPAEEEDRPMSALDLLWAEILQGYALSDEPTYVDWLSETSLIALCDDQATIVAPPRKAQYVQNRLANGIRRELAIRGHRPERIIVQGGGNNAN